MQDQRLYIVVRADLSPGLQAAQAVHAALEFAVAHPQMTSDWTRESNYLILLALPDEYALMGLIEQANKLGIEHTAVREPDVNDEITAVALAPCAASRKLTANLPLMLREPALSG
jgi:peptidyl-tRNA hydrolase